MIYADHNATTPCLPEAAAAVAAALADVPGNPSARHHPGGRAAQARVDQARTEVAALLNARPDSLIFTSGATEACNLAIFGIMERLLATRPGIACPATEHAAVRAPVARMAEAGAIIVQEPDSRTGLVCAMLVNHETGVIQDLPAISAAAHAIGALVVCDASQAPARLAVDVAALGADLVVMSSHKMYGPPGVGALWIRPGLGLAPQLYGGGQERGLRSGTLNVPAIAGFGVAARVARERVATRSTHLTHLTARLEARLRDALPTLVIHGSTGPRAPGTSMITLPGLRSGWLAQLSSIAASAGSACASGTGEPSSVLTALGVAPADARNSLRLGLGEGTTAAEVDLIAAEVIRGALRLMGPG